jgi:tRNA1Val (adenine37-N6)-methyltransferase
MAESPRSRVPVGTAEDHITLDILAGDWRIFQLRTGHRFSADDLLTAWTAVRAKPAACQVLDLGAGIGSVGLLALWKLPIARHLTMVEVQALSHALACRTVAYNGLVGRVTLHHQDLRDWPGGAFDLVTASPPYIPVGQGVQPQHPQKAAARFELHGDIFDYCQAAARSLAAQGIFCFCHTADDARPEYAIRQAGLTLVRRQEVYFRASVPPRMGLFTCAWEGTRTDLPPLVIRDMAGRWTAEYLALRAEMGAPAAFLERARRQA